MPKWVWQDASTESPHLAIIPVWLRNRLAIRALEALRQSSVSKSFPFCIEPYIALVMRKPFAGFASGPCNLLPNCHVRSSLAQCPTKRSPVIGCINASPGKGADTARKAQEAVVRETNYADGRYGKCLNCEGPIVIPGLSHFFCKDCGWVERPPEEYMSIGAEKPDDSRAKGHFD